MVDAEVEHEHHGERDEWRHPVDDEHDEQAEDGPREPQPHAVVAEGGAKAFF